MNGKQTVPWLFLSLKYSLNDALLVLIAYKLCLLCMLCWIKLSASPCMAHLSGKTEPKSMPWGHIILHSANSEAQIHLKLWQVKLKKSNFLLNYSWRSISTVLPLGSLTEQYATLLYWLVYSEARHSHEGHSDDPSRRQLNRRSSTRHRFNLFSLTTPNNLI